MSPQGAGRRRASARRPQDGGRRAIRRPSTRTLSRSAATATAPPRHLPPLHHPRYAAARDQSPPRDLRGQMPAAAWPVRRTPREGDPSRGRRRTALLHTHGRESPRPPPPPPPPPPPSTSSSSSTTSSPRRRDRTHRRRDVATKGDEQLPGRSSPGGRRRSRRSSAGHRARTIAPMRAPPTAVPARRVKASQYVLPTRRVPRSPWSRIPVPPCPRRSDSVAPLRRPLLSVRIRKRPTLTVRHNT